jgi:type II secretory pathway pseudopilin PulG
MAQNMRAGDKEAGFTLLAVMAALFVLALATQQVASVLSQQAQRDREAQLLRVGQAYADAIKSYYESAPGTVRQWPKTVEELLEDRRFVGVRRHLRHAYVDPITQTGKWGIVSAPDGGIAGIYSLGQGTPQRRTTEDGSALGPNYSDWKFVYQPKHARNGH